MKIIRGFTLLWYLLAASFGLSALKDSKADTNQAPLIEYAQRMEQKYNIPQNLLVSICAKESNWRNLRGAHGEIGVCQLKPDSATNALGSPRLDDKPLLRLGYRGRYVRVVQALVGAVVDGIYGPETALLVGEYQQGHKLKIDGITGPKTWASLLGAPHYTVILWNPYTNIEYAAKYIVWLRDTLGTDNPAILMAAYNGGPGNPVVKYMVSVDNYRLAMVNVQ